MVPLSPVLKVFTGAERKMRHVPKIASLLCAGTAFFFLVCSGMHEEPLVRAQAQAVRLPIHFHVPSASGGPIADQAWLEARIRRANQIFAPHDIAFVRHAEEPLSDTYLRVETRRERDALGRYLRPGVINCYVVSALQDVDIPGRYIRGVHWRVRQDRSRRFIILSTLGGRGVLAHELGHYLGNPQHRWVVGNVMSYEWGSELPTFDPDQVQRMRRLIDRELRQGNLIPVESL